MINPYVSAKAGDKIQFGGLDFRVLEIKDDKALVISDKVIEKREYGDSSVWEECYLRQYLNGPFYDCVFTSEEKALIIESKIANKANPLYGTTDSNDTIDRVFLLSVDEIVRYFGDSGQLARGLKYINDEYSPARIAVNKDTGVTDWWYLRSPGDPNNLAVCVGDDGGIYVTGHGVTTHKAGAGGVRPALWLKLKS